VPRLWQSTPVFVLQPDVHAPSSDPDSLAATMSSPAPDQPTQVAVLEDRLLEIARLGLVGDVRSLRQQLRNLQRTGLSAPLSPGARARLAGLVTDNSADAPLRAAARHLGSQEPLAPEVGRPRPVFDAEEPVLDSSLREAVDRLVREHEQRHLLEEANLAPTGRVLLVGPPGSGKTMTARWMASRIGLPLAAVEPSAVLSSLLGESAKALAAAFRVADHEPCVLLLDEFDVFARRRTDINDIGEAKRLVNTLLLELDRLSDRVIVVGATNHPEALDPAVVRRFQLQLRFSVPNTTSRGQIIAGVLDRAGRAVPEAIIGALAATTGGRSAGELVDVAIAAIRRSIIDAVEVDAALVSQFVGARFTGRGEAANDARRKLVALLAAEGYESERLAGLVGSTPATVTAMLAHAVATHGD
jgi:MoxR-like ATPase